MNYDPLVTCPYDPAHRIMQSRMQYHITKCSKNWPCAKSKKKQCPFDARHIVNEIEYNFHITVCPQRESVWRYKIMESNEVKLSKILPIDSTPAAYAVEENWEEDGKFKSYDPKKNTDNREVIRMLEGAQKAERKQYKLQERLRHSRLSGLALMQKKSPTQNNSNQPNSTSIKSTIPEESSTETEQEYKPLRRPKKLPFDTSKMPDFSTINNSTATTETQIQNTVDQNKSLQPAMQDKSSEKENVISQPIKVHSYADALKEQQNSSIESDYDVVIESEKFETNFSLSNIVIDENLVKVSKAVQQLIIGDEGHKRQSKSLDKTLESLKQTEINKSAICDKISNSNNNNNNIFTRQRRSSRCAANFQTPSIN